MTDISCEISGEGNALQRSAFEYVDGQFVPQMPLDAIAAWVENPRKNFDAEGLEELAQSIRENGVEQPIVVRETDPRHWSVEKDHRKPVWYVYDLRRLVNAGQPNATYAPGENYQTYPSLESAQAAVPIFEIVAGERRWRASKLAGKTSIPCLVRTGMDDKTALKLAVIENYQRRDLNAIEEAESYAAMLRVGYTQEQVAQQIGVKQGTISNSLRLRKLPPSIQARVVAGELSASHARALLRFEGFPEVMEFIAAKAVEAGTPSRELEKGLPFANELKREKLAAFVASWVSEFNTSICRTACPFGAFVEGRDGYHYCVKPIHFTELAQAAGRERLENGRRTAEENAALAQTILEASRLLARETGETLPPETPESPFPCLADLELSAYRRVTKEMPGCTEHCECRGMVLDYNRLTPVPICTQPERYRALEEAELEREREAIEREKERVLESLWRRVSEQGDYRGVAAGLLIVPLREVAVRNRKMVAEVFASWGDFDLKPLMELWKKDLYGGVVIEEEVDALLALGLGVEEMVGIAAECKVHGEWNYKANQFRQARTPFSEAMLAYEQRQEAKLKAKFAAEGLKIVTLLEAAARETPREAEITEDDLSEWGRVPEAAEAKTPESAMAAMYR